MGKLITMMALIGSMALMGGCRDRSPVESFDVTVGENSITTEVNLSDSFALELDGFVPVSIKGKDYGHIFLSSKTDEKPFSVGLLVDFSIFTSDAWDGFEPVTTLPSGDPIPGWITPYELIRVDIPSFSSRFDLNLYGGYYNPYYVGTTVSLNFLDDYYPEGLQIFQNFRKDGEIWGTVALYGPTRDSDGEIIDHGGIFFVLSVSALTSLNPGDTISLEPAEYKFEGRDAHIYEDSRRERRKLFRQIQRGIDEFNRKQLQ